MFGTFTRWYSQCIKDESRYHLGFDRKGPHVDDPHLYFNLSHSIELGRKERFDVTSGYFPTFPLGRNSLALEKLARPYLWLTAKGDIAAQRDIYFSFHPLFFTDRWAIERRKETLVDIKNYSPLFLKINKNLSTSMLFDSCGIFLECNRLYFCFFSFFFFILRYTKFSSPTSFVFVTLIRNLWI